MTAIKDTSQKIKNIIEAKEDRENKLNWKISELYVLETCKKVFSEDMQDI